jgi:hypothetical protein
MRFFLKAGTDGLTTVERYDSAALALEAVEGLRTTKDLKIRIIEENGTEVSLATLREMAVEENENDDA